MKTKHIQQIIAFAGSGKLKDGNDASGELREFLSHIPTSLLGTYAEQCLTDKFDCSGFALQDIVNQAGKRLEFEVTDGRYRGVTGNEIGFDGLWQSADSHRIVVEVKTTDAYRIDLNTIANYRRALIKEGRVTEDHSSILIVVGREDTGDLEAQIRGSKHAWDIRLISVDALLRLVSLKESVDDLQIIRKISETLIPREFTKVDAIIDLVFSTAEEVLQAEIEEQDADETSKTKSTAAGFHAACILRVESALETSLVKQARVAYTSPNDSVAVICAVSREYAGRKPPFYWFGFHPPQKQFLESHERAYIALGCGSQETVLLIPFADLESWLDGTWTTIQANGRFYWHISIAKSDGKLHMRRRKGYKPIDLSNYLLK